jgi:secreted trypsin-like serine protease
VSERPGARTSFQPPAAAADIGPVIAPFERSLHRDWMRLPCAMLAAAAVAAGALALALPSPAVAAPAASGSARAARVAHAARVATRDRARVAVIGGQAAEAGTFPWMAYILDFRGEEEGQCSGTVVAANLVLTAGHCAENMQSGVVNEASGYRVTTGNVDSAAPAGERQESDVTRVIVCSCFDRRTLVGDVALLQLSTPTTAPAVTLASSPRVATPAVFAGWGKTFPAQEAPMQALQWAHTMAQTAASCERETSLFSPASEVCAIDPPERRTGVCEGDSGGPLLTADPSAAGGMVEVGVASHTTGHCATTSPSVFTRVDAVGAWIGGWEQALASSPSASESLPPELVAKPKLPGVASGRSVRLANGSISFVLSCNSEGGVCEGDAEASITVRERLIARRAGVRRVLSTRTVKLKLADIAFGIAAGASITARATLSAEDRAMLSRIGAGSRDVVLSGRGVSYGVVVVASSTRRAGGVPRG